MTNQGGDGAVHLVAEGGPAADEPGVRGRPRQADRTPAILTAAGDLLREVGYDRLRVQDVAERAGVGLATIYRRWPTKRELLMDVLKTVEILPAIPVTDDPRRDLEAMIRSLAEKTSGSDPELLPGLVAMSREDRELGEVLRSTVFRKVEDSVREALLRALGSECPDVDCRTALVPGLLVYSCLFRDEPLNPATTAAQLVSILLAPCGTAVSPT